MSAKRIVFSILCILLSGCYNDRPFCYVKSEHNENVLYFDNDCFYKEKEVEFPYAIEHTIDTENNSDTFYYEDLFYDVGYYNLTLETNENNYLLIYDTKESSSLSCYVSHDMKKSTCSEKEMIMIKSMIELRDMFLTIYNQLD